MFLVLVKYKGILYKIMNGDPAVLFHIFKYYLKFFTENIMNFYQSVFPEKTFSKVFAKSRVLG